MYIVNLVMIIVGFQFTSVSEKSDRCLQHLSNLDDLSKNRNRKIKTLIAEQRLGLDILAYGLSAGEDRTLH